MYLKSIDLYGFKSFAQKMVFKFDEGITGIVGPNGSGKSNIADAVRWVLGEQSAKNLRGAKMQDVIFAGTETRKPLGYCQVDLTIDNHDMKMPIEYAEVTISRRVYRSGESEYSINGVECRLKDVHELFMDTGVGKEGYSIIGQGQIEKILSSKPDDRRELFDEAAGIVKFKKRKQVAEKNLDEEKMNLIRINDIVRELHSQQEILKDQAVVAKDYLEYKENLKKYEVNIFIHESGKLIQGIEEIHEKENILTGQIDEIRASSIALKEKYSELNGVVEALEQETDLYKETVTEYAIEKEKKESNIVLVREQINNLQANSERINVQNRELMIKQERNQQDQSTYTVNLDQLKLTYEDREAIFTEKQQEFEAFQNVISTDEQKIEQIQTNRIERLNEISNVKTKIQRYHTMLENMDSRKTIIEQRKQNFLNDERTLQGQVHEFTGQMDQFLATQKLTTEKKASLAKLVGEQELKSRETELKVRSKSEELHTSQSRFKALNDLAEQYEGYSFSIKKIMELKKNKPSESKGVLGVVADIIEVQKEYETAIEIALGASVQNIVTDDETTAKNLIHYLKTNQYGRATFLPLTSIKNREQYKPLSAKDVGFIGYASGLVSAKQKFSNVVEYLLGRVVVVDHIDHAIALAKKYNYSLKMVTLTGDLINPGGSLTGGAFKNQSNQFLSRKRDLEQYEKNIEVFTKELEELKAQFEEVQIAYLEGKKEIEALANAEYETNLLINEMALKLKQLEREAQKYSEELMDLNIEWEQLLKQSDQITKSMSEVELMLEGSQSENNQDENTVKALSDEIMEKKALKDVLSEELTKIRVEVSTVKQQYENAKENMTRIDRDLGEIHKQVGLNEEEIKVTQITIEDKQASIITIQSEIQVLEEKLQGVHQKIEILQAKRHEVAETQHDIYRQREEQNEQINLLEKDILRLQNSKDKLELQRDTQIEYMWNEYELTLNKALEYKDETLGSVTNLKKMIAEIKSCIKGLGDVNVNAIEDFKTVSDRYLFLTEQKDDLIKAEEKLKKVIEELNEQMIRQFKEKFKEISVKFNEVFRELFGGGKAFLELTEDEDILEAGIELIAQPPGKKLQSMRLLSGGEKAFTAIALLFAIQSLRPSPFCVLDEIEAALDDANVVRFAKYLQKLTVNTQFIIITHRRGTMEVADTLYGITMQEKGISTQVSVKLLEDVID